MALTSMSCSDSSSESEPIYKNWLDPYDFFKERGCMNCWSFKNMRISDLDDLIYTTWNRDSVVSPTGEKSRIKNFTIEINKDNTYIEHLPKGKVVHNIRKMEIKEKIRIKTENGKIKTLECNLYPKYNNKKVFLSLSAEI